MKGLHLKALTAAVALGISPLLLSAQLPVDTPDAQLDSGAKASGKALQGAGNDAKVGADADAKARGSIQNPDLKTPNRKTAPQPPAVNPGGKALDGAKGDVQNKADANLRNKANVQNKSDANLQNKGVLDNEANLQNKADANLQNKARLQNQTDAQLKSNMKMRRQTNRPNLDASGEVEGQANMQVDPMVREGTAHLDIDEATRARYRYHNGHWWYMTEHGQWMFDNNGTWEPFDPVTYRHPGQRMSPQTYQDADNGNAQTYSDGSYYYEDDSYTRYYDDGRYYNGYNSRPYYNNFNRGFNNRRGYYRDGNYGRDYYNNRGRNRGRYGSGYRGFSRDQRRGAAIGAEIGGSLGGRTGAAIGAGIGAEVAD